VVVAEKCSLGENARNGEVVTLKLTWEMQDRLSGTRCLSLTRTTGRRHISNVIASGPLRWFALVYNAMAAAATQLSLAVMHHFKSKCTSVAECQAGIDHAKFRARLP
jgi:hypothetical protein